ncbi:sensor histidine kinase [Mycetocola reblochoni]|uniref:Two-component system, sensor protein n=2 Tax=Mycetocola reblochoni TaxID=331618 RepID=A0A1R4K0S9_9MICO|nr:sensor histidine kinase [Mycetocola reblochoni]RLP70491.1 hypothetical protein D9V30_03020 [Mycetocola reblochoni]SJN37675.1 Two-component system, sensor protein [Mycetocola reblochoni REB411]
MSPDRLLRPPRGVAPQPDFTLRRVQRLLQVSVALYALVFGTQSLFVALGEGTGLPPVIGEVVVAVCHLLVAGVAVAGLLGRGARQVNACFAIAYLLVIAMWPVLGSASDPMGHPWTWFLCSLASACAVQAAGLVVSALYVAVASIGYGAAQFLVLPRSEVATTTALLDTSYALMIGYLIVTLWLIFRTAAVSLDTARNAALVRYDEVVRQDVVGAERIAVDALVHDSVLAALQTAARAEDAPGGRAARTMAARAIAVLVSSPDVDPDELRQRTSVAYLRRELASRVAASGAGAVFRDLLSAEGGTLPRDVAEALVRAATQALENSVAHAGGPGVNRCVTLRGGAGNVVIVVEDDGSGFVPATVEPRRLGLRVSIIERMAVFGGDVTLDTAPGEGTRVELRWPAPQDGGATWR